MALDENRDSKPSAAPGTVEPAMSFRARHWLVGTNVAVMVILAVVLFCFVQYVGFKFGSRVRADMTSRGVNSLRPATKELVRNLDSTVTLTSLYHVTDIDEENQKFLQAVEDLFALYQGVNRSNIEIETINPLKDLNERSELIKRLREKEKYVAETQKHQELIEFFQNEAYPKLKSLLDAERAEVDKYQQSDSAFAALPDVQNILRGCEALARNADELIQDIEPALREDIPLYSAVANDIRNLVTRTGGPRSFLRSIIDWASNVASERGDQLSSEVRQFLAGTTARYQEVIDALGEVDKRSQDLPTLKLDDLRREIAQSNTIVVETKDDARILPFADVWPRKQQGGFGGGSKFEDHFFAGEAHITSSILQMTQSEKPAVVFVKFGGGAVFMDAGFNPMQPRQPARFPQMKRTLERLNFTVEEWDVQASKEPPTLDPEPNQIVYVILRPESAQPQMPGMPPNPQGQFDDVSRQAVLSAVRESKRAMFLAGWATPSGPIPIPSPYGYSDFLKNDWGLNIRGEVLTLAFINFEPGKWFFRRNPPTLALTDFTFGSHLITEGIETQPGMFPAATPIERTETPPEGVDVVNLVTVKSSADIWGETDVMGLQSEMQKLGYSPGRGDADIAPPYPVAVAATKEDWKLVVISSDGFAEDQVTNQRTMMLGASGLVLQQANPANGPFFVNCVQWLADQEDRMGLGAVTEFAESRIEIQDGPTLAAWRWFAWAGWPAAVLLCGAGAWFVRRR